MTEEDHKTMEAARAKKARKLKKFFDHPEAKKQLQLIEERIRFMPRAVYPDPLPDEE